MTSMNSVHSGVQPAIDRAKERRGLSAIVVVTLAIAVFLICCVTFYSFSGGLPTTVTTSYSRVTDAFKALEASRPLPPPTTTGQGSR